MALLRKVFQQGNSPVVALPPSYLIALGVDTGDNAVLSIHRPKRGPAYIKLRRFDATRDDSLDPRYDREP